MTPLKIKVKNIMTKNIVVAEIPGSRRRVLDLMLKTGHSELPVVKKGTRKLIGMVTRDTLIRKPEEEDLALLVDRNVSRISPDESIGRTIQIMLENNVRTLPVVDSEDEIVGVISVYDIISKIVSKINIGESIEKYYRRTIPTAWEETPLRVAFAIMKYLKTNVLLALDINANLTGIITIDDLIRQAEVIVSEMKSSLTAPSEGMAWSWDPITIVYIARSVLLFPENMKLKDVMTKNVMTVSEYTSVSRCAKLMAERDFDQLPVIGLQGELKGIVYDVDILRAALKYLA
ncbi:MAG: inosine-5-monophosphate dehydrogenase [Thermoprotei archaeon]|nr:MAG: inosine-5-monophosphate dehydrogenase [Thermoprotei archaeon]RLF02709.1 MAG: inosine-5-monophosphate dehydrogenase [Thermoprotei archaeon]